MKRQNKVNATKVEVTFDKATSDFYRQVAQEELFDNVVTNKIVTIDVSKIEKVNVMSMSRVAFFRKLVKLNTNFNNIAIYDFRFYAQTNDRSKTRHNDKYVNNKLNNDYVRMRTAKQLRDVLKEKDIVAFLNAKHNLKQEFFTVSEYKKLVK